VLIKNTKIYFNYFNFFFSHKNLNFEIICSLFFYKLYLLSYIPQVPWKTMIYLLLDTFAIDILVIIAKKCLQASTFLRPNDITL